MKKYLVFTSVLALAACGGGSGGGIAPDTLTEAQRVAAIESNSQITDMNSFIVVGGTNPTTNPNARAAGTRQADGGIRYNLEDVEFKTASMLMNADVDKGATVKFETKDGKINKINISLDGMGDQGKYVDMNIEGVRRGDTNVFADGILSFKEDNEEQAQNLPNEDFGLLYSSKAKENNQGLHYADWGVIQWGDVGDWDSSHYFAGGYDIKRTDKDNYAHMNELAQHAESGKLVFQGRADGVVRVGDMADDADTHYTEGVNKLTLSTDATLEFANGTSTLTANFDNWYDVSATMGKNGKLDSLTFSNGDKVDGESNPAITDNFKWQRNGAYLNNHIAEETRNIPITDPNFYCPYDSCSENVVRDGFVEYYGDDKNPAEAVGVIRYGDSIHEGGAMRFDMGFGGKRN